MATKDTLTGLFNRHFLNMLAVREEAVVDRSGNPLSLMLIDIDDFKAINDSFGHLAGDKALCDFAGFLREHTRESDYLFRLGGDEFLVLMTGAGEDACTVFGQRLQLQANAWNEARVAMELVSIHFSLGCATAVSPFKLEELLDAADEKMYLNKLQGHHLLARHQAGVAQIR
jgi:diguanylate cyclase